LADIVNSALHGSIYSSLLDDKEFNQQLNEIKTQLPIGSGKPIDIAEISISELLRIVEVSVVYLEGILFFTIEIPLVNDNLILYKSIPLPLKVYNNFYSIIEPTFDYIALDKPLSHYIQLSDHQ